MPRKIKRQLKVAVATALVLVSGLYFISPVYSQQGTLFADAFLMAAYDWKPVSGTWAVVDGEYTETEGPSTTPAWTKAGSVGWIDYAVEAKIRATDTEGTISLAGRWVDENNYYALEYSSDSTGAPSAKLVLYKKVNGVRINLQEFLRSNDQRVPYIGAGAAAVLDNPVDTNGAATVKLHIKGANIKVYVKNTLNQWQEIGFTSDTALYYGQIALGETNRQAYFDEVYVWDVTPPTIGPTPEGNVTTDGTTATITWNTDEKASARVEYGLTTSYGSFKSHTTRLVEHRIDLTGLLPNTRYYYQIKVKDSAGNEQVSPGSFFDTTGVVDSTPPAITGVGTSGLTGSGVAINWTTDELSDCLVEYGTAPGSYKWMQARGDLTTNHAVYLDKLEGSTTYYYRVKTRDVAGNSATSQEYSFTTLKNLKPKVIRTSTGSTPSVNISVYWRRLPSALRYKVYISTDQNFSTPDTIIDETGKNTYSFNKAGLLAYTNYFVKIEGEDGTSDKDSTIVRLYPPDPNPHGHYDDQPELCGECHSAHYGKGQRLVTQATINLLCINCHDGTGSKYDVLRGVFKAPVSETVYSWAYSFAGPYGDIEGRSVSETESLTSRHDLTMPIYFATGNNVTNAETADAHLSCSSCHDPHGTANFRNLKTKMRTSVDPSTPLIDMEAYAVTKATQEEVHYVKGAVNFCGSCHSDFIQPAGSGHKAVRNTAQPGFSLSLSSTDMYMHPVDIDGNYETKTGVTVPKPDNFPGDDIKVPYENGKIICQTCHFTHGTQRQGTHTRRDGYQSTVLKRFDQTVGCEACHNKTNYPD